MLPGGPPGSPPGGPPDPFGPPYPLDPITIEFPDGTRRDVERTFDRDGVSYQVFDDTGNVVGGGNVPPTRGD